MRLLASAVRAPFGGLTLLIALAACCPAAAPKVLEVAAPKPAEEGPPVARMVAVVEHQFGVDVADPYRWMEGNDNAQYKTWLGAQGEYARKQLSKLPGRDALFARLRELVRVEADVGHGIGSTRDQTFAATADVFAFMLQQFGVPLADR
jgi:protease II